MDKVLARSHNIRDWDEIESIRADIEKRCKFGFDCYKFPCKYIHKREEYYFVPSIKQVRAYFLEQNYEELCKYNIGQEKNVSDLIDSLNSFDRRKRFTVMAEFLRQIQEKRLLQNNPLKIDTKFANRSEKEKIILRMKSYALARIYILYYRDEIETIQGILVVVALQLEILLKKNDDESLVTQMFFNSRGFIDSNIEAIRDSTSSLVNILQNTKNTYYFSEASIVTNAHKLFKDKIIGTIGFQRGLLAFLKSLNYSEDRFNQAVDILKSLKTKIVQDVPFNGMCGLNNIIYINPQAAWGKFQKVEVKLSRMIALIIHESGHQLVRHLKDDFEATTPRGTEYTDKLEGGYRFEFHIFGKLYEFEYWIATDAINDPLRWLDVPFVFKEQESKFIEATSRNIQNPYQSGLEVGRRALFE